jgi:hypothetical protein
MDTLLLDRTTWDLLLDANGNIAIASGTYAIAQDIASAVRAFVGEVYYDTSLGLPYMQQILGRGQSLALFEADAAAQALTVPGVASARCVASVSPITRQVTGAILFTTTSGQSGSVAI